MTPIEVKACSLRVQLPQTDGERELSLDLTEGTRLHTIQNLDHYIKKAKAWYDPRVALRNFKRGELVLRHALAPRKLRNKWEGTYLVPNSNRPGSYRLADAEGTRLEHSWNAETLRKYYV